LGHRLTAARLDKLEQRQDHDDGHQECDPPTWTQHRAGGDGGGVQSTKGPRASASMRRDERVNAGHSEPNIAAAIHASRALYARSG